MRATAVVVLVGAISWAHPSRASSCAGDGPWERQDADAVFQGEVVEVHEPLQLQFRPSHANRVIVLAWQLWRDAAQPFDADVRTSFRVNKSWKGRPAQFVTVIAERRVFEEGDEYVVYAVNEGDDLYVVGCAGSALAGSELPPADIGLLGPSAPPTPGWKVPMFWRHWLLPAPITALTLLVAVLWSRRSKRRYQLRWPSL